MAMFFLFLLSCKSSKILPNKSTDIRAEHKKMIADGFIKGIIQKADSVEDCLYVIKCESPDDIAYYDPVDLPEIFKRNNLTIWFKFSASRRMQKCAKAMPVILNGDIHLRK